MAHRPQSSNDNVEQLVQSLAVLELEEDSDEEVAPETPGPSPPRTPEPPASPLQRARSLPATPAAGTAGTAVTASSRRVYIYSSPTKPRTYTTSWSEASTATQGTSGGEVKALRKSKKRRGGTAAYVVFRGRRIGVMDTWDEARAAISQFRFAIHQRYATHELATRAFAWASENGWTFEGEAWVARPVDIARAPLPVASDDPSRLPARRLCARNPGDPWYVVYQGINPGIFPTSFECALNVQGIELASCDHADTFAEARARFDTANSNGEVRARRKSKAE
ncbi:hypothetical protein GGX14DRAFT_556182 [Mycena pura]|uniref:Ribonuclease H1 N-terminal domain-containing protein n=1 Tax=Mycena pura TaxID=153505 RepID=A0AAD7E386_9AGAR|nr:hypothetical protein GGX14DRAFT_556182 [Mycena pura]